VKMENGIDRKHRETKGAKETEQEEREKGSIGSAQGRHSRVIKWVPKLTTCCSDKTGLKAKVARLAEPRATYTIKLVP